jgi:hypothetical protein
MNQIHLSKDIDNNDIYYNYLKNPTPEESLVIDKGIEDMVKLESDIAFFFQKPIESQEVQQYLDKEYKSVLSIGDNQNLEKFKAPNKTWKQIKEDRDRLKSLESKKPKEFDSIQTLLTF